MTNYNYKNSAKAFSFQDCNGAKIALNLVNFIENKEGLNYHQNFN